MELDKNTRKFLKQVKKLEPDFNNGVVKKQSRKEVIHMNTEILTPSPNGENCLYNGTNENFECACDECEYFLECFGE